MKLETQGWYLFIIALIVSVFFANLSTTAIVLAIGGAALMVCAVLLSIAEVIAKRGH